MSREPNCPNGRLTGHALRNLHLREKSLRRAETAPPLARALVRIRAESLGMTRLEFARRSGISRGTLRDLELGIHQPTRQTLQRFVIFCQRNQIDADRLEELRLLYAGPCETLEQFIGRLELKAGSTRALARSVGISPATLWEYRRGNFPLPPALLRRMCEVVDEKPDCALELWHERERKRLVDRGYPEAWAEFCVLCTRAGHTESQLAELGVRTAALRRLRYLELPPWAEVAEAARSLCADDAKLDSLHTLWLRNEREQRQQAAELFGPRLKELRQKENISRRELADLFGVGGKKPARIIKYVEEDGFYSAQAYPAGLAALVVQDEKEQGRMLELWKQRRRQLHRRHRPETRTDLRLARELYGFEHRDMEPILGYSGLEYQKIERGVGPLLESAQSRILEAVEQAGRRRVQELLQERQRRLSERTAWQSPPSMLGLLQLLARREGGLAPLARLLTQAGVQGVSIPRLRGIVQGREVPPWHLLDAVANACGVVDLADVRHDWTERYRQRLEARKLSPLAVELRLLIAEVAPTLRALSPRLGFNYSVLVRDLLRIDREEPLRWFHVERILKAVGLPPECERWREVRALWGTSAARRKKPSPFARRASVSANGRRQPAGLAALPAG